MEKKIKENLIYKGRIITLYNDDVICENNKLTKREYVHHNGGAGILAVKDDKILLIKQFRYPYNKEIHEIPAGKIELGENPYLTAIRELEEECALKAPSLEELGYIYPTCGYSDEVIYLYLDKEFTLTKTNFDEDENITSKWYTISEVLKMIDNNEIVDAKTLIAIYRYLAKKA